MTSRYGIAHKAAEFVGKANLPWTPAGRSASTTTGSAEIAPRTREPGPIPNTLEIAGSGDEPASSAGFYPRLQRRLRTGDTLVIETGTCMLHLNGMRLPAGVGAEGQGLWGSIG